MASCLRMFCVPTFARFSALRHHLIEIEVATLVVNIGIILLVNFKVGKILKLVTAPEISFQWWSIGRA